jgi:tRNA A37 N6-isopentenylltransferase MiaA
MQDQIDDIDSKIENLPSEEELAVLKTVPVQVSQINQRVDKNDELDNQQNQQIEQVKDIADTAEMMISNLRLRDSQRYASLHDLANHIISLRKEIQKATGKKIDSTDSIDFINNLRRESREQALNRLARERSINRRQLQPRIREKSTDKSLPESYLKEIDTLAERILGEQYGKYLK